MVNPKVGIHLAASLDRVMVEMKGEQVPLRQVGQISMPNPQMLLINMSSYPQVGRQTVCGYSQAPVSAHDDLFWLCVC